MYIRRKINASGSMSVQIVQKNGGKIKILSTIGSSKLALEIDQLIQLAQEEIKRFQLKTELPFHHNLEAQYVANFNNSIQQLQLVGPELY